LTLGLDELFQIGTAHESFDGLCLDGSKDEGNAGRRRHNGGFDEVRSQHDGKRTSPTETKEKRINDRTRKDEPVGDEDAVLMRQERSTKRGPCSFLYTFQPRDGIKASSHVDD
jgi:hypothetical protein